MTTKIYVTQPSRVGNYFRMQEDTEEPNFFTSSFRAVGTRAVYNLT